MTELENVTSWWGGLVLLFPIRGDIKDRTRSPRVEFASTNPTSVSSAFLASVQWNTILFHESHSY